MCNLYSLTKGQKAIIALARATNDRIGNLPPMPGTFPDYPAPMVRKGTRRAGRTEPVARQVHAGPYCLSRG